MTIALNPKATFEWIDPDDRKLDEGDPNRTVWELRSLTPQEEASVTDAVMLSQSDNEALNSTTGYGTVAYKTVQLGLVAAKSFRDADGNEIEIVRNKKSDGTRFVTDATMARIPGRVRARMCNAITQGGQVDEGEQKKQ